MKRVQRPKQAKGYVVQRVINQAVKCSREGFKFQSGKREWQNRNESKTFQLDLGYSMLSLLPNTYLSCVCLPTQLIRRKTHVRR